MSDFFIVKKRNSYIDSGLAECSNYLVKLALERKIGIHFNKSDYESNLLNELKITQDYFFVSDSFQNLEANELYDVNDYFDSIKHLKKEEFDIKQREKLQEKYEFFNRIVEILFNQSNIESVDFYFSQQESSLIDFKKIVFVENRNLTESFIDRLKPTKREPFFGLKTTKFIIK